MKPFHKKRLLKLAAHLKTVPNAKFNMSYFGGPVKGCATDGCAAGHAADLFRRQGYTCEPAPAFQSCGLPRFKTLTGGEAIKMFFGIDDNGYAFIFSSANSPSTPEQVAKRIELWVK